MSLWQVVGISAIWMAAGVRVGWLWCDYRRWERRIYRERRRDVAKR